MQLCITFVGLEAGGCEAQDLADWHTFAKQHSRAVHAAALPWQWEVWQSWGVWGAVQWPKSWRSGTSFTEHVVSMSLVYNGIQGKSKVMLYHVWPGISLHHLLLQILGYLASYKYRMTCVLRSRIRGQAWGRTYLCPLGDAFPCNLWLLYCHGSYCVIFEAGPVQFWALAIFALPIHNNSCRNTFYVVHCRLVVLHKLKISGRFANSFSKKSSHLTSLMCQEHCTDYLF